MIKRSGLFLIFACQCTHALVSSLSDDSARWYKEGERIALNYHKLSSTATWISHNPYTLPFCQPEGGYQAQTGTFGQLLVGERAMSSPYRIEMKKDVYCQQLCISNLGRHEATSVHKNKVAKSIHHNYHHNWSLDGLPSAAKRENETIITVRYFGGFPIGYLNDNPLSSQAYIYNHVNIEVVYHPARDRPSEYNVVRFTVEPFSIQHDFEPPDQQQEGEMIGVATMSNPIDSCNPDVPLHHRDHTTWEMVTGKGRQPQLASGKVLFTYDVIWIASLELEWTSRWDVYISMDNAVPDRVHFFFVLNSIVPFLLVSSIVLFVLICKLRNNLPTRYISVMLDDEEEGQEMEEELSGWKAIRQYAFHPPSFQPLLFFSMCGVGTQILCAFLITLVMCNLNVLSPSKQGSIVLGFLLAMIAFSPVSGYVSVGLYKSLKNEGVWMDAFKLSAVFHHGLCFVIVATMDVLFTFADHSASIGAARILVLIILMGVLSAPLTFVGSYFASRTSRLSFPTKQDDEEEGQHIARPIPTIRRWKRNALAFGIILMGLLPLLPGGAERFFLYHAIWNGQYYHSYGYLLLVACETIIIVAEVTLMFHAFYLCAENHRWWWRSFCIGGLPALYMFLFSINFFHKSLEHAEVVFATYVMFFGCMLLVCFNIFLLFGTIGALSCLALNMMIYNSY